MGEHKVTVDVGGEYKGEMYLWCEHVSPHEVVYFEGDTVAELLEFLHEHKVI